MHLVQALLFLLAVVGLSNAAAIGKRQHAFEASHGNLITRSDPASSCGSNTIYIEGRGCVYDPNANNGGGGSGSGSSSCGSNTVFVLGKGCVYDSNAKTKRENL